MKIDDLVQTGEHDAAEDASPEELERLAQDPASKAWVISLCLRCWVKRWVRSVRLKIAVAVGFAICLNALGYVSARIAFEAAVEKAVNKVTPGIVRQSVIDALRENRIISAAPSPAAGDSVASLIGGGP